MQIELGWLAQWATADTAVVCTMALLAGVVRGFSGFGSGMILVAGLSALYGPMVAVPVVLLCELIVSLPLLRACWRDAQWTLIGRFILMAAISAPLGVWLLARVPVHVAQYLIPGIILIFVLFMLLERGKTEPARTQAGGLGTWFAGAMSGFFGGFSGMTGPPVVLYLLRSGLQAPLVRASLVVYFVLVDGLIATNFFLQHDLGKLELQLVLWTILPLIIGAHLGGLLFPLASEKTFRRIALMVISGAALLGMWGAQ